MVDIGQGELMVISLSRPEKLNNPAYLNRLLWNYLEQIHNIARKLNMPCVTLGKRQRQKDHLAHLQKHCVPFVVRQLESLGQPPDQDLVLELKRWGVLI